MKEFWKGIQGYKDRYQVSNFGRVKSLDREVKYINGRVDNLKRKILKPSFDKDNYTVVTLYKNNNRKTFKIHRLLLETLGPKKPSKKHICNHKDGNKQNNNIENLEWVTPLENMRHACNTGLCNGKMLSTKIIKKIQKEYIPYKISAMFLAKKYGVSERTILRIVHNKIAKRGF